MTFLNKYQVAERLQVTTRTIDKWIKEGYFPKGRYVKRRPFWSEREVDNWWKSRPNLKGVSQILCLP